MTNIKTFLSILFFMGFSSFNLILAQTVLDKWENRNDEGKVNSIIEVYEQDNQIFGRIEKIMKEEDRDRKCTACEGDLHNEPLEGLVIMRGLEKEGDGYEDGVIIDPESGKEYKCKIWLDPENPDKLYVRGYIAFFYKTKVWERLK
ncbi:DUF2147 domain-containing protein [Salegentibacter sp. F188]|uniref:DUF2147 domain-containing protein n=1 Tax=Autumnicola patrickiae TaxID=3075591 RepID=A0ABU3E3P1_9FLAO|nr:DUF2147 domain-containing protein [Salegentibacter sp. F188]MDT0689877.1 DUF2147 domain-containing protein [Salegentibacter sp. F188]